MTNTKSQISKAEIRSRHYDERSEEVTAARSASSAQLICSKISTDSFVVPPRYDVFVLLFDKLLSNIYNPQSKI